MHEFAVTEEIVQIALAAAADAGAARIRAVHVAVGSLTGIVEESMRFYFDTLIPATAAAGARLVVEQRPATAICETCGHSFPAPLPLALECPLCGAATLSISGGRELLLTQIEVDVTDETDETEETGETGETPVFPPVKAQL